MTGLPYGLTSSNIRTAVLQVEHYISRINASARAEDLPSLLEVLTPSAISGLVSELMVSRLDAACPLLTKNTMVGGFPDLLPIDIYENNCAQKGTFGVEVKASKKVKWQGHNVEEGWLLAVKYSIDSESDKVIINSVYVASLSKDDWTFCPRRESSRRTPTASINKSGLKKLRNSLYYSDGDQNGMEG